MSYERALKTIRLQSTDRVARQETLDHPQFMEQRIGYDPWQDPLQAYVDAYRAVEMDWVINLPRHSVRFANGESCQKGEDGVLYTEWGLSGSVWHESFPFDDIDDVLAYDPIQSTAPKDLITDTEADQNLMGKDAIVSGIFYTTLFQHPVMTFGWEPFLAAAAAQPDQFQRILEGFAEVSRRDLERYMTRKPDLVLIHDDIAMEEGLVFHPDWYRKRLFPLYHHILEPLWAHQDTRVAFASDGDYTPVLDDLVALGFNGFFINDNMDLNAIARRIGHDHFLVGNVSTLVLTNGTVDNVRNEVRRCIEDAIPCAGHVIKATRDLPHNIPLENICAYFDAIDEFGHKR